MSQGGRGWRCTFEHGEVPEGGWQSLGDQVGREQWGVHQAPRMRRTASWHGHGLPRGAAGGGHGKEGGGHTTTPAERESKKESVGPSLGLSNSVCLSCLVTCLL